jgi:serine/threonine protein kinase
VAKGESYVGMASDVWSVGIILYAMVTATLPFDGPKPEAVLKNIVRGDFAVPLHLPKELQDLLRLMLTLDPKERITIQQIKQHPWYLGLPTADTPRTEGGNAPYDPEPFVVYLKELQDNSDVLANLKLLGWEEPELMNELLDDKMNWAKVFYKLLIEHKNLPLDENDNSKIADKTTVRRKSRKNSHSRNSRRVSISSSSTPPLNQSRSESKRKSSKHSSSRAFDSGSLSRSSTPEKLRGRSGTVSEEESVHRESFAARVRKRARPQSVIISNSASCSMSLSKSSEKSSSNNKTLWGISPTLAPEAKKYQVESTKSVTELLEALKHCFADLGQYDLSAKQTKNMIIVKARKSGKRHGTPVVTVNLLHRGEETALVMKGGKSKVEFKEIAKKMEETLVV